RGDRARALSLIFMQAIAFWPVWRWYLNRMGDSSDEPWGVLALVAAVLLLCRDGSREARLSRYQFKTVVALGIVYTVTFAAVPPLVRDILAVLSIGITGSALLSQKTIHLGLVGLLILSLPLIASLQFYLGYPVRFVTTQIAAALVSFSGFAVEA